MSKIIIKFESLLSKQYSKDISFWTVIINNYHTKKYLIIWKRCAMFPAIWPKFTDYNETLEKETEKKQKKLFSLYGDVCVCCEIIHKNYPKKI